MIIDLEIPEGKDVNDLTEDEFVNIMRVACQNCYKDLIKGCIIKFMLYNKQYKIKTHKQKNR